MDLSSLSLIVLPTSLVMSMVLLFMHFRRRGAWGQFALAFWAICLICLVEVIEMHELLRVWFPVIIFAHLIVRGLDWKRAA